MKNTTFTITIARLALMGALVLSVAARTTFAQNTTANEGGDLAFGGPGKEPGKFLVLQDIAFDPRGVLYTLDGIRMNNQKKELEGNLRVQRFDRTGKFLGAIDLKTAPGIEWTEKNPPQRVAADSAGNVYVTVTTPGKVLQWDAAGAFVRAIDVPRAMAISLANTAAGERIAVVPSNREVVPGKGWTWMEGDKIVLLTSAGTIDKTIALPTPS